MIPDREKQIGARLKAFREALQISRSKFAVSCGFGSERMASYDSGRVPVPYEVFKGVSKNYFLNPFWLALGDQATPRRFNSPFDDGGFIEQVRSRSLFSEVYDDFISVMYKEFQGQRQKLRIPDLEAMHQKIVRLKAHSIATPHHLNEEAGRLLAELQSFQNQLGKDLTFRAGVAAHLPEKQVYLDKAKSLGQDGAVKAKSPVIESLPDLLNEIRMRVKERGQKSALANEMEVSRQAVDQWLDGSAKPSADITFKLLNWVWKFECKK